MKTSFQLTTWDRMMIATTIGALRGDVKLMRKAGKLLDVIELSPDEREEIGFKYDETRGFAAWEQQDRRWDITIADPEILVFLNETLRAKNDWPATQNKQVIMLYDAFGIE